MGHTMGHLPMGCSTPWEMLQTNQWETFPMGRIGLWCTMGPHDPWDAPWFLGTGRSQNRLVAISLAAFDLWILTVRTLASTAWLWHGSFLSKSRKSSLIVTVTAFRPVHCTSSVKSLVPRRNWGRDSEASLLLWILLHFLGLKDSLNHALTNIYTKNQNARKFNEKIAKKIMVGENSFQEECFLDGQSMHFSGLLHLRSPSRFVPQFKTKSQFKQGFFSLASKS